MSPPYHHGNVSRALVEETLRLIDVDGLEAFSLRRAAAAVGVSPMAAYRHFPGRDGLLRSAAASALDELGAELEAELLGQPSTPDRVHALLRGYLEAAVRRPNRFRLMFGPAGAGHPDGVLGAPGAGPRPQRTFVAIAAELAGSDTGSDVALMTAAAMLWAAVHGLATLVVDGPLPIAMARDLADRLASAPLWLGPPPPDRRPATG